MEHVTLENMVADALKLGAEISIKVETDRIGLVHYTVTFSSLDGSWVSNWKCWRDEENAVAYQNARARAVEFDGKSDGSVRCCRLGAGVGNRCADSEG
jgi:hypothetical protein